MQPLWSRTKEGILTYSNVVGCIVLDSIDCNDTDFAQWHVIVRSDNDEVTLLSITATHNHNTVKFNEALLNAGFSAKDHTTEVILYEGKLVLKITTAKKVSYKVYRGLSNLSYRDDWNDGGFY